MANKNLCICILIATLVAQATWVQAAEYIVGDDKGWAPGFDYQTWVQGKEFYEGDTLVFVYDKDKYNVLCTWKAHAEVCCPVGAYREEPRCGRNVVTLGAATDFGFVTSNRCDCFKGMRLVVTAKPKPCPALHEVKIAVLA